MPYSTTIFVTIWRPNGGIECTTYTRNTAARVLRAYRRAGHQIDRAGDEYVVYTAGAIAAHQAIADRVAAALAGYDPVAVTRSLCLH